MNKIFQNDIKITIFHVGLSWTIIWGFSDILSFCSTVILKSPLKSVNSLSCWLCMASLVSTEYEYFGKRFGCVVSLSSFSLVLSKYDWISGSQAIDKQITPTTGYQMSFNSVEFFWCQIYPVNPAPASSNRNAIPKNITFFVERLSEINKALNKATPIGIKNTQFMSNMTLYCCVMAGIFNTNIHTPNISIALTKKPWK